MYSCKIPSHANKSKVSEIHTFHTSKILHQNSFKNCWFYSSNCLQYFMFSGLSSGNSLGLTRYMYDADISLLLMLTNVAVVILLHELLKEHRYCNICGTLLMSCLYTAVTTTAMEDRRNIHWHTATKL